MSKKKKKMTKKDRQNMERKKSMKKLAWILAGCIVLGGSLGFILGKCLLYPAYQQQHEDYEDTEEEEWEESDYLDFSHVVGGVAVKTNFCC